jgi:hypothetical protein
MLAAGTAEPIGHPHQYSIDKREPPAGLLHTVCFWALLSRPAATRTESFSKAWRVFSIAASRIPRNREMDR